MLDILDEVDILVMYLVEVGIGSFGIELDDPFMNGTGVHGSFGSRSAEHLPCHRLNVVHWPSHQLNRRLMVLSNVPILIDGSAHKMRALGQKTYRAERSDLVFPIGSSRIPGGGADWSKVMSVVSSMIPI